MLFFQGNTRKLARSHRVAAQRGKNLGALPTNLCKSQNKSINHLLEKTDRYFCLEIVLHTAAISILGKRSFLLWATGAPPLFGD